MPKSKSTASPFGFRDKFHSKQTLLNRAIHNNSSEEVDYLLTYHKDSIQLNNEPDSEFINKDTPLHIAVSYENTHIIRSLINAGADVNQKNSLGETAFDLFCEYKQLRQNPANVYIIDSDNDKELIRLLSPNNDLTPYTQEVKVSFSREKETWVTKACPPPSRSTKDHQLARKFEVFFF